MGYNRRGKDTASCNPAGGICMGPHERAATLFNRRRLLQLGGIGMLGLGLPQLLHARAPGPARRGSERSCIFIVQYGGASHIDSWDLKPDAAADIRGPYKPIATRVPGIQIGDRLP